MIPFLGRGRDGFSESMGKIRINELARELEVKPAKLLELLPEFGITDKRTPLVRLMTTWPIGCGATLDSASGAGARRRATASPGTGSADRGRPDEEAPEPHGATPHIARKPAVAEVARPRSGPGQANEQCPRSPCFQ